MSAREELFEAMTGGWPLAPGEAESVNRMIDAFRAEVLGEAAPLLDAVCEKEGEERCPDGGAVITRDDQSGTPYVVMTGSIPLGTAASLEAAQAHAEAEATRYGTTRELRWDVHYAGCRLMSRTGGRGRFSWSQYWVAEVPVIVSGGAA
ncbi:hypothetical protein ACH4FX_12300 [Streptomyces sp. NPDC018019]|uniref:hypothetical protein n=1 Tax=Streptomyces sp. NPDC018019 TaxID=3365030 RepID=UPI00378EA072